MIRQATTPRAKLRFYNACRGKLCLGATMPLALELLGKSQPSRFFAGPTLALEYRATYEQNQIKRKTQTEMPDPDFQVVMRSSITFGFAQKEILYRR